MRSGASDPRVIPSGTLPAMPQRTVAWDTLPLQLLDFYRVFWPSLCPLPRLPEPTCPSLATWFPGGGRTRQDPPQHTLYNLKVILVGSQNQPQEQSEHISPQLHQERTISFRLPTLHFGQPTLHHQGIIYRDKAFQPCKDFSHSSC